MNRYKIPHFLADTWWFALTSRTSDEQFLALVQLRQKQGFTAAQLVVGIPPETGVYNPNAQSPYGPAWDLDHNINEAYLQFARKRIQIMNDHNLTAILYGAWGHQIEWTGEAFMHTWWKRIIKEFDKYDVIYCLTGELDIWLNPTLTNILLPDKTSSDVTFSDYSFSDAAYTARCRKWESVLADISGLSEKPVILHPLPGHGSIEFLQNKSLAAANTFQTGHELINKKHLWESILASKKSYPGLPVINLEYYYEGIFGNYYKDFQLSALWCSVVSGCHALCYGAHGIWNMSDGAFLGQWGSQTFSEALCLDTPYILGKTYRMLVSENLLDLENQGIDQTDGTAISLWGVSPEGKKVIYYSDAARFKDIPAGKYFHVLSGTFSDTIPASGQLAVIICP